MTRILTIIALLFATPMLAACASPWDNYRKASPQERQTLAESYCRVLANRDGVAFGRIFWLHKTQEMPRGRVYFSSMQECKASAWPLFQLLLAEKPGYQTEASQQSALQKGRMIVWEAAKINLEPRCAARGYKSGTERMEDCLFNMANTDRAIYAAELAAERAEKAVKDAEFNEKIQSIFDNNN